MIILSGVFPYFLQSTVSLFEGCVMPDFQDPKDLGPEIDLSSISTNGTNDSPLSAKPGSHAASATHSSEPEGLEPGLGTMPRVIAAYATYLDLIASTSALQIKGPELYSSKIRIDEFNRGLNARDFQFCGEVAFAHNSTSFCDYHRTDATPLSTRVGKWARAIAGSSLGIGDAGILDTIVAHKTDALYQAQIKDALDKGKPISFESSSDTVRNPGLFAPRQTFITTTAVDAGHFGTYDQSSPAHFFCELESPQSVCGYSTTIHGYSDNHGYFRYALHYMPPNVDYTSEIHGVAASLLRSKTPPDQVLDKLRDKLKADTVFGTVATPPSNPLMAELLGFRYT